MTTLNPLAQQVIDAVTDEYLKTQKSMTVKEISQRLSLNPNKTRDLVNQIYNDAKTCSILSCRKEERPTFSKDYPMFQHGYTRVYAYEPSKSYLAKLLNDRITAGIDKYQEEEEEEEEL